jgi:hypothetical protein
MKYGDLDGQKIPSLCAFPALIRWSFAHSPIGLNSTLYTGSSFIGIDRVYQRNSSGKPAIKPGIKYDKVIS